MHPHNSGKIIPPSPFLRPHAARAISSLALSLFAGSSILMGAPTTLHAQESGETRSMAISGLLLTNYQYHVENGTNPAEQEQIGAGSEQSRFMLERVYLTATANISQQANVRLTFESKEGAAGQDLRLKYAYIDYKLPWLREAGAFVRAGMLQNIMIAHEEIFWPRMVSSAPLARVSYYSAADLGVAVGAKLPKGLGEVYAELVDGRGYQGMNEPDDRFRDMAVRLTLTPLASNERAGLFRNLTISPWIYLGDTASVFGPGSKRADEEGYLGPMRDGRQRDRMGLLVGVDDPRISAAVSLARRTSEIEAGDNTAESPVSVARRTGTLASAFMEFRPLAMVSATGRSPLGIVLRYDRLDTDRSAPGYTSYVVGGVTYAISPGLSVSLDYQETMARAGQLPTRSTQRQVYFVHLRADF